jgi:hypothetical protein
MNKIEDNKINKTDYMILMSIYTISILGAFFLISK